MKVGDLVKFKQGYGWESVGLVIAMCHIDMIRVLWAIPSGADYPTGWHSLAHLEAA